MGIDRNIYLSAYALIKFKKIEVVSEYQGCREHGKISSDYCSKCGNKPETLEVVESEYPFIYNIFDDLDIAEDVFYVAGNDEDRIMVILLPNTGEHSIDDYKDLQIEISPEMPEESIKSFKEEYGEELEKIKSETESIESCTVKFGVVQYYN